MWRVIKRLAFGTGPRPFKIWFGVGSGARFVIDPSNKSQRIVGLDEAELSQLFRRNATGASTFIDIGASDGYYPIVALRLNATLTAIGCEPQKQFEQIARENYRLNFPNSGPSMEWVAKQVGTGEGRVSLDELAH